MKAKSLATLLSAMLVLQLLPGCIVGEIRDNLKQVNSQLAQVNSDINATRTQIESVNARLTGMHADLGSTNTKLIDVQSGLSRVDTTNLSLGTLDGQLTSMQGSLTSIDGHLGGLRKTIGAIDGMIPFLDLESGGTNAASPPSTPAGETQSADATPAKAVSITGTWVSVHASPAVAWLLRPDGSYIIGRAAEDATALTISGHGTWTVSDGEEPRLVLESTLRQKMFPDEPARGDQVSRLTQTFTIAQQTSRSLTLINSSQIVVLRRP